MFGAFGVGNAFTIAQTRRRDRSVPGDHQDAVIARDVLRRMAFEGSHIPKKGCT
jgi:hypothetical protein